MAIKPYILVGGFALFGGLLVDALGAWQLIDWLTPTKARVVITSVLYIVAIICLAKAAWSAWQLQLNAEAALRLATKANQDLSRRIEEAEAKLVRALDEGVIDWTPAYTRLQELADRRITERADESLNMLRQAYNSFRRMAELGYLGGDDKSKAPPPITPRDI